MLPVPTHLSFYHLILGNLVPDTLDFYYPQLMQLSGILSLSVLPSLSSSPEQAVEKQEGKDGSCIHKVP